MEIIAGKIQCLLNMTNLAILKKKTVYYKVQDYNSTMKILYSDGTTISFVQLLKPCKLFNVLMLNINMFHLIYSTKYVLQYISSKIH